MAVEVDHCGCCCLRRDLCVCGLAPRIKLGGKAQSDQWLLLTHEREVDKPSNTGKLVLSSLQAVQKLMWQRKLALDLPADRAVLVFPSDKIPESNPVSVNIDRDEPIVWVVLDATWQQAAKMVRQSPELRQLPCYSLGDDIKSDYHLRRNQQGVSTLEAIAHLVSARGDACGARQLLNYQTVFQQHWELDRSNRAL